MSRDALRLPDRQLHADRSWRVNQGTDAAGCERDRLLILRSQLVGQVLADQRHFPTTILRPEPNAQVDLGIAALLQQRVGADSVAPLALEGDLEPGRVCAERSPARRLT